ncbi:MAG: hypothetical protein U0270_45405 [Labilithrix sp.]
MPSREAMEAERLAREARERRQANDQLVITIWRVAGGIGIAIALFMVFVNWKSGHHITAGRIVLRSILFGGGGIGALLRGNTLARRSHEVAPPPAPMMHHYSAPPFPMHQTQPQPQQQQQAQPGQITRWTD